MSTTKKPMNKKDGSGKGVGQKAGMRKNKNPKPGTLGRKGVGKGKNR